MAVKNDNVKKSRGRSPAGGILVEGHWQLTAESVELATQRLIKHRLHSQERYRAMRDAIHQQRPELFVPPRPKQKLLVRSNELGEELSKNQTKATCKLCLQSATSSDYSVLKFSASPVPAPLARREALP